MSDQPQRKPPLAPGTRLPNGKIVVRSDSHPTIGGPRLKVDPKTGKVTRADAEDETRREPSDS